MDDNIKLLIEINQNIVKLIESLSKEKDFISLLIENGVFVLIASITQLYSPIGIIRHKIKDSKYLKTINLKSHLKMSCNQSVKSYSLKNMIQY